MATRIEINDCHAHSDKCKKGIHEFYNEYVQMRFTVRYQSAIRTIIEYHGLY